MTTSESERFGPQWFVILALVAIIAATGCSPKTPYNSHCDTAALDKLKGRPVALLAFQQKDNVLLYVDPIPPEAAKIVLDQHKAAFLSQFGRFFRLTDQSAQVAAELPLLQGTDNSENVGKVVRTIGAEGGFVVTNAYAYKMVSGNWEDQIRDFVLEHFLPKKWVGVIGGPSQIQDYDFASDVELVDGDGHVVWHFYGKAQVWPTFSELFRPGEFMRSVAGLDPSIQSLARVMIRMSVEYTEFTAWMMQRDLDGESGKSYYNDYLPGRPRSPVSIFPVEEEAYRPEVEGHSLLERNFPSPNHAP